MCILYLEVIGIAYVKIYLYLTGILKILDMKKISGIYAIVNIKTKQRYIGSSKSIRWRLFDHFGRLENGKHRNQHLQHSFDKYGREMFAFVILETCSEEDLLSREQHHLDTTPWKLTFNKSKEAKGGGSDVLKNTLYLLDLDGNIVDEYESGAALGRAFGRRGITYRTINTSAIFERKYRIVTPDFYEQKRGTIRNWNNYTNESKEKSKNYQKDKYYAEIDGERHTTNTYSGLGRLVGRSGERVRQLLTKNDTKLLPNGIKIGKLT